MLDMVVDKRVREYLRIIYILLLNLLVSII